MGPTCSVFGRCRLSVETLTRIDSLLESSADCIEKTKKGQHWRLWIDGRPYVVSAGESGGHCDTFATLGIGGNSYAEGLQSLVVLESGLNDRQDYEVLSRLSAEIARIIDGTAVEPEK